MFDIFVEQSFSHNGAPLWRPQAVLQGAAAVKEKENRSSFSFGTANKALSQRTVPRDAQATDEVEREFVLPQTPGGKGSLSGVAVTDMT